MDASNSPMIEKLDVSLYRVETDSPESDGTLKWDHTDVVVAHASAGGLTGLGWTYASRAAADLIHDALRHSVIDQPALGIEGCWRKMVHQLRNVGVPGAGMMAVAAVDIAQWDLKAKLLGVSLVDLFGTVRDEVEIYGSGGFTSYSDQQLTEQLSGWAESGIRHVKMKVGRDPAADPRRVRAARRAIGDKTGLFVDANGGYGLKQALAMADVFGAESNVLWFEEPRPSSDLVGLSFLRQRAPAAMEIAAGEYGDLLGYFRRMLEAGSVDCLQADATRCGGYTGLLKVAALCDAFQVPLSAHCAPQLHAHIGCGLACLRHIEYFHDHNRIDRLLFDGSLNPDHGCLKPDPMRPGHGMTLKDADAARYRIS
jgi:L-alanine-DL-glutamate epimerase-like enolase superfamily enzyme